MASEESLELYGEMLAGVNFVSVKKGVLLGVSSERVSAGGDLGKENLVEVGLVDRVATLEELDEVSKRSYRVLVEGASWNVDREKEYFSLGIGDCSINSVIGFRASLPGSLVGQRTGADGILRPPGGLKVPRVGLIGDVLRILSDLGVVDVSEVSSDSVGPAALFSGMLAGVSVLILLDSGAQTNLVSRSFLDNNPHVATMRKGELRLRFGDNKEATSLGELCDLSVQVQGDEVLLPVVNVSPYSMVGCDLILGTPFLNQTEGAFSIKKGISTFQFPSGNVWHGLDGLGGVRDATNISVISTQKEMKSYFNKNKDGLDRFVIQLQAVAAKSTELKSASGEGKIHPGLAKLFEEFSDVGVDSLPPGVQRVEGVDPDEAFLKIPLKEGATPKAHRAFPMSQGEQLVLQQMLAELLEKNYIEPASSASGWAAPIFLLRKPGQRDNPLQQFRLIVDFRALNAVTEAATYIPPDIRQLIMDLKGASVFSITDCLMGYYQQGLLERDRDKTTFACHTPDGVRFFRFRVACLGLSGAVAAFQLFMEKVLDGLQDRVRAYIDDFIIFTKDMDSHIATLRELFMRLREHKVYISWKKCVWAAPQLEYLGLLISKNKIDITEEKRAALRDYAVPKDFNAVRRFVGFANYLSQFVPHFSGTVAPLTDLLKGDLKGKKKEKFVWSESCQKAFDDIREALTKSTGLHIPLSGCPFVVETDASLMGVGAALYQVVGGRYRPVWFASHKLSKSERNYAPRDVELLAVVFALKKFRQYLALEKFDLFCDHESLALFKTQATLKGKDWRWASQIGDYNFTHYYRKGETMLVPDAISRAVDTLEEAPGVEEILESMKMEDASLWSEVDLDTVCLRTKENKLIDVRMHSVFTMASINSEWRTSLKGKYVLDPDMHVLVQLLGREAASLSLADRARVKNFSLAEGLLWFHPDSGLGRAPRLCVPKVPGNGLRLLVMFESHDSLLHQGLEKSYVRLSSGFYWEGMRGSLERYIRSCETCRLIKSRNIRNEGFRSGHRVSDSRWEVVAVDFITDLQVTEEGFDCILVAMDTLTKFTYLVPACKTDSAEDSAWRLFERVFLCSWYAESFTV